MPSKFDPFNSRLCRDIRNGLSEGFMNQQQAAKISQDNIRDHSKKTDDTFLIASLILDQELFFEVHDYLELHWMKASGDNKIIIQALWSSWDRI